MNKVIKKSLIIGTPILAATTLGATLSIALISCSPEQIKSVLDRIFNAIKAVESLSGKDLGSQDEVKNAITVQDLKQTLTKGFGLTEKQFNEGIKNIDIEKKPNADEWEVYVLLKPEYSWPEDVLNSKYNSNNQFGNGESKEPKFYADKRLLEFTVTRANFDKVAIYEKDISKELVAKSLNQINGANDHTNDEGKGEIQDPGKQMLTYRISSNDANFISSSISISKSTVNFQPWTEIQPAPGENALIDNLKDEVTPPSDIHNNSILSFENSDSKLYNRDYRCDVDFKPADGFVFLNEQNQVTESLTYDNLLYNQADVVMGEKDIKKIYNAISSNWSAFKELQSIDEINQKLLEIKTTLINNPSDSSRDDEQPSTTKNQFFAECLTDITAVKVGTAILDNGKEYEKLVIKLSFNYTDNDVKKEINIKTFEYPNSSASKNNGQLVIKTDDWVNNIVLSNEFVSSILVNKENQFFKA